MRKIMIAVIFAVSALAAVAQDSTIQYIVGCEKMGYPVEVKTTSVNFDVKQHKAPVLSYYAVNKDNYVGGYLINQKGDTTLIKDITVEVLKSGEVKFIVVGEKFKKTLYTNKESHLLERSANLAKFYTLTDGVWTITKKI